MYNTMYSADSMELISIVVYTLGCAIAPVGRSLTIIPSHGAALGSCVLTNFDRFGVDAKDILGSVNGNCHIFADFTAGDFVAVCIQQADCRIDFHIRCHIIQRNIHHCTAYRIHR